MKLEDLIKKVSRRRWMKVKVKMCNSHKLKRKSKGGGLSSASSLQRNIFIAVHSGNSAGDVDAMSYLRLIMRYSGKIRHLLISTWVMAEEDVQQFQEWLESGRIEKADFYVGEIFPGSYVVEYNHLKEFADKYGRIAVFRNHSKIIAGEMSANINTNPRKEQGVITIDDGLYHFFKDYFDGIVSF